MALISSKLIVTVVYSKVLGLNKHEINFVEEKLNQLKPRIQHTIGFNPYNPEADTGIELYRYNYGSENDGSTIVKLANNKLRELVVRHKGIKDIQVLANAIQTQMQDGAIASYANSGEHVGFNIHDALNTSIDKFAELTVRQNKATFDSTARYHQQLASLMPLIDTLVKAKELDMVTEAMYQKIVDTLASKSQEIDDALADSNEAIEVQTFNALIMAIELGVQADLNKLEQWKTIKDVQQYAGEDGKYELTKADYDLLTEQTKLINQVTDKLKQRLEKSFNRSIEKISTNQEATNSTKSGVGLSGRKVSIFEGLWSVQDVRNNPDSIFVFGDNLERYGTGGQAIIRNEPNAMGIVTKNKPKTGASAYMSDDQLESNKKVIDKDIQAIIDTGKPVIFSSGGLGTNLADLENKAPKTWEYLNQRLKQEFGYVNGKSAYVVSEATNSINNHQIPTDLLDKPFKLSDKLDSLLQVKTIGLPDNQDYSSNLTKRIAQINPNVQIQIVSDVSTLDKQTQSDVKAGGMYYPHNNSIIINPNAQDWQSSILELINHELVHSITADVIGFDDLPSKLNDEITKEYQNLLNELNQFRMISFDKFSELFNDRLDYAVNSNFPHELVSIFSSEIGIRSELQSLDLNLFKKLNDLIKRTVRIKADERSQTTHTSGNTGNGQNRSNRHVLPTDTTTAGSSQNVSQTDTTSQNNTRDTSTTQGDLSDAKSQVDLDHEPIQRRNQRAVQATDNQRLSADASQDQRATTTSQDNQRNIENSTDSNQSNGTEQRANPKRYTILTLTKSVNKLNVPKELRSFYDLLAKHVTTHNEDLTFVMNDMGTQHHGKYDNTNTVTLNTQIFRNNTMSDVEKLTAINHEIIHALTETGIAKGGKAVNDLQAMYQQLKDKANGLYEIQLETFYEFIAYGMTDKAFADFINQNLDLKPLNIPTKKGRLTNFLTAVFSMFGLQKSTSYKTFASRVEEVMQVKYDKDTINQQVKYSQSAMKDIEANIKRGTKAMNKALLTKADVHRAMYRNDIGWIDFVWGDTGIIKDNGKTKGAKGISHIIEARMRKDNMSYADVVKMLTQDVVSTIAKGETHKVFYSADGKSNNLKIRHEGYEVNLVKRIGSNSWIITAYELKKSDDDVAKSKDLTTPTHTKATLHRSSMGASELFEDGTGKGDGKTSPTHNQSYSARTDVGASNKVSDGESRVGGYTSTPTHTKPTMTRQDVGASDKDSLIQDIQDYNNQSRYSTLPKTTTEILTGLDSTNLSDDFNNHLDKLIQRIIGDYEASDTNRANEVKHALNKATGAIKAGYKLTQKEAHTIQALQPIIEAYIKQHAGHFSVSELYTIYHELTDNLTVKDFIPNYDQASKAEKQHAKNLKDYIFANKGNNNTEFLARFITLSVASEQFNQIINKPRPKKYTNQGSWFDVIMSKIEDIISWFTGLMQQTKRGNNNQQITGLINNLQRIDNKVRKQQDNLLDQTWGIAVKPIGYVNNTLIDAIRKTYVKLDLENSKYDTLRQMAKASKVAVNLDKYAQEAVDLISENSPNSRLNTIAETLNEVAQGSELYKPVEKLSRLMNNAQAVRKETDQMTQKLLKEQFSKALTKAEKISITQALLKTDMGALLNHFSITQVQSWIINDNKRKDKIAQIEDTLSQHINGNDMLIQTKILGAYMAREITPPHLLKNAESIAIGLGTEHQTDFDNMDTQLYQHIDTLASLYALEYTDKTALDTVKALFNTENKAIKYLLKQHQQLVNQSKADFAFNRYNYAKGYTPQIYNPYRNLEFVSKDDEDYTNKLKELQLDSYEIITEELPQDNLDTTGARTLLLNTNFKRQKHVSGALDMYDSHSRGTVVYDDTDPQELSRVAKTNAQKRIERNQNISYTDYNPLEETSSMVINFGSDGRIMDYHYEMQGYVRDSLLDRDNDVFTLMGKWSGDLAYKPEVKENQRNIIDTLHQDYVENYAKAPHKFVALDPESNDPKLIQQWQMLPYEARERAKELYGKGQPIMVRNDVYNMVFGFRRYSIKDMFDKISGERNTFEKIFVAISQLILGGEKAKYRLYKAEQWVQEIEKYLKSFIVIRNFDVLIGNIMANNLSLLLMGVKPTQLIKGYVSAWRNGNRYGKLHNQLIQLNLRINNGEKGLSQKRNALIKELENNPTHKYMQAGIKSTIVDDVGLEKENNKYQSDLEQVIDKAYNLLPKPFKVGVDWLFMNENTPLYEMMADATQFSDFAAKFVLAEHLQKQGMGFDDAVSEAQEAFINFDVPTSKAIDYANNVGILRFTKFLFRFQKFLLKNLRDRPAQLIASTMMTEYMDTQGLLDASVLTRLGNNPFEPSILDGWDAFRNISTVDFIW